MKSILCATLFPFLLGACGQSLPEQGDYWLELRNMYGEWEKAVLITGYLDDYEACSEFLEAIREWNDKNSPLQREYRCTPV